MARSVLGERLEKENITIFGLLNIPWLCKMKVYGESARIIGPKKGLYMAMVPKNT